MDSLGICWLFVACILLTSLPQKCMAMKFNMSPVHDLYLLVGSILQLNCTISRDQSTTLSSADSYTAHDLSIRHQNTNISHGLFTYYEPELTLGLTIHNVSISDDGMYTCHYNNSNSIEGLRAVHVAVPPSEPTNLTCISYNFKDLNCSFFLANNGSSLDVNWTMEYKTMRPTRFAICDFLGKCAPKVVPSTPSVTGGSYVCDGIPATNFCPTKQYNIVVTGVNEHFQFTPNKTFMKVANGSIVKPDRVESLTAQLVGDNHMVTLDWSYPKYLNANDMGQVEFSVALTQQHCWDCRQAKYIPPPPEKASLFPEWPTEFQYNVTNLMAYSNYTASVKMRSVEAVDDMYWSEPATVTFQTPASDPSEAPSVAQGAYWVQDTGDGCDGEFLCVTVYWKVPPEQTWAGLVREFLVNIDNSKSPTVQRSSAGMISYVQIEEVVNQAEGYTVSIQMANNVGVSPKSSDIILYPWKQVKTIHADWVSIQQSGDSALLSWSPPRDLCKDITTVTYYCCPTLADIDSRHLPNCQTFDWMTVNVDGICEDTVHQWLNKTGDPSDMRYAVSISTDVGSGGIVWDKYRYSNYNASPVKPIYQVKSDDHSLSVAMTFQELPEINQGGQPSFLELIYSEVTSTEASCPEGVAPERYPVDFSNHTFVISNLQAGAQYVVCVRAGNDAGLGPYGDPMSIKMPKGDSSNLVVSIVFPVVAGLVFVGLSVYIYFKCRKRIQQFIRDKTHISIPDHFDIERQDDGNKSEEVDSGHGTQNETSRQLLTEQPGDRNSHAVTLSTSNGSCLSGYYKINGPSDHLYLDEDINGPSDHLYLDEDINGPSDHLYLDEDLLSKCVERPAGQSNEGFVSLSDENLQVSCSEHLEENKEINERGQPLEDFSSLVQSGKENGDKRYLEAVEVAINLDDHLAGQNADHGSGTDDQVDVLTANGACSPAQIEITATGTNLDDNTEFTDTTSISASGTEDDMPEMSSCPYKNPENISLDSSAFSEISESESIRSGDGSESSAFVQAGEGSMTEAEGMKESRDEMCNFFVNSGFEKEMESDFSQCAIFIAAHSSAVKGQFESPAVETEPPVINCDHSGTKSSGGSVSSYSTACIPEGGSRGRKESDDSRHFSEKNAIPPTNDLKIQLTLDTPLGHPMTVEETKL